MHCLGMKYQYLQDHKLANGDAALARRNAASD
jgi:hypothetical protein